VDAWRTSLLALINNSLNLGSGQQVAWRGVTPTFWRLLLLDSWCPLFGTWTDGTDGYSGLTNDVAVAAAAGGPWRPDWPER